MVEVDTRYETILVEMARPQVMLLTLNRPEVGNACNTQMGHDLLNLWTSLIVDPGDVRCVVLTGAGDRIFCAGGDLKERNGMTDVQFLTQHAMFERKIAAMADCPVPIIAAVNGHCYAGGLEMSLHCDFIYAADHARFALTECSIGIMPGGGGTVNLPLAAGIRRAKEIILTARPFSASEAAAWGIVNAVFDRGALVDAALDTAQRIAENAPLSVRQARKSMNVGQQLDRRNAFVFEIEAYNHLVGTHDRLEGIAAFNEKRKAEFKGR